MNLEQWREYFQTRREKTERERREGQAWLDQYPDLPPDERAEVQEDIEWCHQHERELDELQQLAEATAGMILLLVQKHEAPTLLDYLTMNASELADEALRLRRESALSRRARGVIESGGPA